MVGRQVDDRNQRAYQALDIAAGSVIPNLNGGTIHMASGDEEQLRKLGQIFKRFSEETYIGSSPLYASLSNGVANDIDVLDIASSARGRPVPNLLFAAVHYLLFGGADSTLSSFYASLTRDPRPNSEGYPHFREFCLAHESAIRDLLSTRLVQTNEVGRCAYLLPAFSLIADENPGLPLSLVDIGASAGLHLLWDRYSYEYGGCPRRRRVFSVRIKAEVRGSGSPPISSGFPTVEFRIGLDLNPVRLTDSDAALWLRALIWPEHERRAAQLNAAIGLAIDNPPTLIAGDALETLPEVLDRIPAESTLCIFHNYTLNQFSREDRSRFDAILDECSMERDVHLLSGEGLWGQNYATLELVSIRGGSRSRRRLANVDYHGKWLEWLA